LAHLTGELFRVKTGVDIVVMPYKGAATAVTDILGGQVEMTFEPTSVLMGHIHDAKVRPLAVTAAARIPQLPEVPTMIESGLPVSRPIRGAGSWRPQVPRPRSWIGSMQPSIGA
jgi:tripartite-type tricarboxylate transporter receptor subunit TctC